MSVPVVLELAQRAVAQACAHSAGVVEQAESGALAWRGLELWVDALLQVRLAALASLPPDVHEFL